jgi:transposase, IS5 family
MSFFMLGADKKLKKYNKLVKLNVLIDWSKLKKYLKEIHKNDINPRGGRKAYDNLKMFKAVLLGQWHTLSDPELEEALSVRIDFMAFTGFDLNDDIPDSTTLCRFRNILIAKGLDKYLFNEINFQLEQLGLKLEKAKGAVIDATVIESAARPRKTINIENDREETGTTVDIEESKDPDAKWLKKGNKSYFGFKGFVVTDTDDGFIQTVHTESANEAEINKLDKLIPEINAERLYADKGYCSENNRNLLQGKFKDGIMHKAQKNKPLTERQKLVNKLISHKRFIVEQCFGTLKRIFSFTRASYMAIAKVNAQLRLKAICFNLLKAVNKIEAVSYCV